MKKKQKKLIFDNERRTWEMKPATKVHSTEKGKKGYKRMRNEREKKIDLE